MSETMRSVGLGIIIVKVRFQVSVSKVTWGFGFRTNMYVDLGEMNEHQRLAMQLWCDENDLLLQSRVQEKDALKAWVDALTPYETLLCDTRGWERMKWMMATPMPQARSKSWNDFYEWAEQWDNLNDGLKPN